jgi:hypothetical protein
MDRANYVSLEFSFILAKVKNGKADRVVFDFRCLNTVLKKVEHMLSTARDIHPLQS